MVRGKGTKFVVAVKEHDTVLEDTRYISLTPNYERDVVLIFQVTNCHNYFQAAHWRSGKSSHKVVCRQLETSGTESEFGNAFIELK